MGSLTVALPPYEARSLRTARRRAGAAHRAAARRGGWHAPHTAAGRDGPRGDCDPWIALRRRGAAEDLQDRRDLRLLGTARRRRVEPARARRQDRDRPL